LEQLITQTKAHVSCLIRAGGEQGAWDRLSENLSKYKLGWLLRTSRISVVCGDLSKPHLGLSENKFSLIAHQIDAIYHNGADVNHLKTYGQLYDSNVLGTKTLIELAAGPDPKPLHFVSTNAAFDNAADSGYVLSKIAAEDLVLECRRNGTPGFIYRMPRLSPDDRNAIGNHNDAMLMLFDTIIRLGTAPDLLLKEAWVPVDAAAQTLIEIAEGSPDTPTLSFSAAHETSLEQLVVIARNLGAEVAVESASSWAERVKTGSSPRDEIVLALLSLDEQESLGAAVGSAESTGNDESGFVTHIVKGRRVDTLERYVARLLAK
jgi:thioester reductase-like protein